MYFFIVNRIIVNGIKRIMAISRGFLHVHKGILLPKYEGYKIPGEPRQYYSTTQRELVWRKVLPNTLKSFFFHEYRASTHP